MRFRSEGPRSGICTRAGPRGDTESPPDLAPPSGAGPTPSVNRIFPWAQDAWGIASHGQPGNRGPGAPCLPDPAADTTTFLKAVVFDPGRAWWRSEGPPNHHRGRPFIPASRV